MKTLIAIVHTVIFASLSLSIAAQSAPQKVVEGVSIVQLAQTEGVYETTSLTLAAGQYMFEVTNKDVAKPLGFYLTPQGMGDKQIPNSGLNALVDKGQTSTTGIVKLEPGVYNYSCPLNPTPHYTLTVK